MSDLTCFKAYDIRGVVPDQLDADLAWRLGRAFAAAFSPRRVVVGRDVRHTSLELADALARGLADGGVDVGDLGLCATEEVYFATAHTGADGGIMVTASHNPREYNGMKLVGPGAAPIYGQAGLFDLRERIAAGDLGRPGARRGTISRLENRAAYIEKLLSFVDTGSLPPLRLVVNPGNGCAGPILDALEPRLPFSLIKIHHRPDGGFPNGIPNPLLPECRSATAQAVRAHGADLGLAWDGDADRCFFFDERGEFIEGYYLVGLLAGLLLARHPGATILHDPRLVWNTRDIVAGLGGRPVETVTGHAFIKARMRREDAVYGGEMSAHHYFRDFACCDSGMIPWLLVTAALGAAGRPLSELVGSMVRAYPASGEINLRPGDPQAALDRLEARYAGEALEVGRLDGLSLDLGAWRVNVRRSNTEPLLRLNLESRGDPELMAAKTREVLALLADPLPEETAQ